MDFENEIKINNKVNLAKKIVLVIFAVVVLWFCLTLIEYFRVRTHHRPFLCFNETKDVADVDEYSLTCYGLLYKYREYHFIKDDALSAREFSLFFIDFDRSAE